METKMETRKETKQIEIGNEARGIDPNTGNVFIGIVIEIEPNEIRLGCKGVIKVFPPAYIKEL